MRVCAAFGRPTELRPPMGEYRLDVFGTAPEGLGENDVLTLCGHPASEIPAGFRGLVDSGEAVVPGFRCIRSIHDFERTPDAGSIVRTLSEGDQEVSKGAYMVNDLEDLHSIFTASKALNRRHLILGMGELGAVTRIRQTLLGNEFTFGYIGEPTAPGQLSAEEMGRLGDDCRIAGILGHPLGHSLSPAMQDAAMRTAGINGIYLRFDTPSLECLGDVVREYRIRGMNVTIPYKRDVVPHLDSISDSADSVGAVNTIVNDDGELTGHNTDVAGIVHSFKEAGTPMKGMKVLLIGSGGAARAAARACAVSGCEGTVIARNGTTSGEMCRDFGLGRTDSPDVSGYDAVINCTPIGMDGDSPYPIDLGTLHEGQTVLDMVYNRRTLLVSEAERRGCGIASGLEMLIGQGAESFRLWFGKEPDVDAMRRAVS